MGTESNAEKLTRLRAEKAARAAASAELAEAAEIAALELEAKYSAELGREGVDFAMVLAPELGPDGIIVVKLGSDLAFRKFVDATTTAEGGVDAADLYAFVSPAVVHPSTEKYTEIVRSRGFLANRAADALASLHGVRGKKVEGKY